MNFQRRSSKDVRGDSVSEWEKRLEKPSVPLMAKGPPGPPKIVEIEEKYSAIEGDISCFHCCCWCCQFVNDDFNAADTVVNLFDVVVADDVNLFDVLVVADVPNFINVVVADVEVVVSIQN
jgi:hypothetical protein